MQNVEKELISFKWVKEVVALFWCASHLSSWRAHPTCEGPMLNSPLTKQIQTPISHFSLIRR